MATILPNNTNTDTLPNTGFGTMAADRGGRLLNKDGSPNVKKTGVGIFERYSWYHSMLTINRWKFFSLILLFYTGVNIVFATIYYLIGVQHLQGMQVQTELEKFTEAFFFSTQTFTTVGYGRISPSGFAMSAAASFHALLGLLSFAVVAGLIYARFGMPKAYIKFSNSGLISPYNNGTALMVRITPYKSTAPLADVEAKISLAMIVETDGVFKNKFYNLSLEAAKINSLVLSWTLVHPITEDSPLWGFTLEEYHKANVELLVYVKGFDDTFSNIVIARTSYTATELLYGYKFTPMYSRADTENTTILKVGLLNSYRSVDMPKIG